jgi:hypothetical protein
MQAEPWQGATAAPAFQGPRLHSVSAQNLLVGMRTVLGIGREGLGVVSVLVPNLEVEKFGFLPRLHGISVMIMFMGSCSGMIWCCGSFGLSIQVRDQLCSICSDWSYIGCTLTKGGCLICGPSCMIPSKTVSLFGA